MTDDPRPSMPHEIAFLRSALRNYAFGVDMALELLDERRPEEAAEYLKVFAERAAHDVIGALRWT